MMTETKPIILRSSDLRKEFQQDGQTGIQVVRGIDLEVYRGEILSIVGVSGAGKSTLLHLLGGLDRPTHGKVYWQEKDIFALDDATLARLRVKHVGFVFQFHHLLPEFTAQENVALAAMIAGEQKGAAMERAKKLLGRIGMSNRRDHKPSELSGGEQQRVAVARALINNPPVVLADEPSGNLDSANARQLQELIHDLNKEGQTFVIVTHNDNLAKQCDRMFRMADGILRSA